MAARSAVSLIAAATVLSVVEGAKHNGKVFGLGPGRTGTASLKLALEELGFGPTYHMEEALFEKAGISTEGHFAIWQRAGEVCTHCDFGPVAHGRGSRSWH